MRRKIIFCLQVSLPVRFVIIILTPTMDMEYDAHEIGRSISTLMSNQASRACKGENITKIAKLP